MSSIVPDLSSLLAQASPDARNLPTNSPNPSAELTGQSLQQAPLPPPPQQGGRLKKILSNFAEGFGDAIAAQHGLQTEGQKRQQQFQNQIALRNASVSEQNANTMENWRLSQEDAKTKQLAPFTVTPELAAANPSLKPLVGQSVPKVFLDVLGKMGVAQIGANSRENVAATNATAKTDTANINAGSRMDQFRQSQTFKTWKANLDNQTKLKVAQMTAGKAPAAMMQTATFANSGLDLLNDARTAFEDLKHQGVLGDVGQDKIENWIFGHGYIDPSLSPEVRNKIGKLRAAMSYTSSAAMRAHTGRTSQEIYNDFKNTLGLNQGADALEGAMDETGKMLGGYARSASDAAIQNLRNAAGANSKNKIVVTQDDLNRMKR